MSRAGRARLVLALAILAALVAAAFWLAGRDGQGGQRVQARLVALAGDAEGYRRAEGPLPISFPADHGPHPDYQVEWWYYTGNLETGDGRHLGYQLTFFRRALAPPHERVERESAWATNQAYMAHLAVTDVAGRRFHAFERFARDGAGLAGAIMMAAIIAAASATILATGLAGDFDIPWGAVATLLPFFILGYVLFAAMYATAGSLVSRMEDFGAAQMPVMILSFVAIYVPAFGWSQLDSTFMRVASWIPPASVTTAPLQYAMGNFSGLQLLGAGAILAVSCLLMLFLAAKIYPRNVLRTGSRVTWLQAIKG